MELLQQFAQTNPSWSLEEFVEVINHFLPQFLPVEKAHTRVREEVTSRLVRYYTSLGMVDEPQKQGRRAVYTYRHLLQMLVVRRLLTEGYGASAIAYLPTAKSNAELEALLTGGVQLSIETANPALGFLEQIRQRNSYPTPQPSVIATPKPKISNWKRIEVVPGLEIHVREDFIAPNTPIEQENLLQYIAKKLFHPFGGKKP